MILLSIDTSTDHLSLALSDGDKMIGRFHGKVGRNHSRLLMPKIEQLLKRCRVAPEDLDCFCVSVGPGSFTGLRIGVTAVKGLAYALKKRIVAVPTLDAIAYNAKDFEGIVCPVLDARKKKVYAAIYKSDGYTVKKISKDLLVSAEDLLKKTGRYKDVFFLGDGVALTGKAERRPDWHPRPEALARLGAEQYRKKRFVSVEDLEPLYIYSRECDITGK
jgi:tRNA threonylcarbamoyladenosine biosynthesis protein TsaB